MIVVILRILLSLILSMRDVSIKCPVFSLQKVLDGVPQYH